MNLLWKLRRLQVMGAAEILHRIGRALQVAGEQAGFGLARDEQPSPNTTSAGVPWLSLAPGEVDVARYRAAADRVLAGHFTIFAEADLALGFPPQWNREPRTGIEVPLHFGKSIDYRDSRVVGDVKFLWEINRHLQLVTLAQAWHLTRDARYAEGCRTWLQSWFEQCPYPLGINWTSSLEAAFRLVNWSATWHLLDGLASPLFQGESGDAFRQAWLRSIRQHCHFVAGHLSLHSSANNHLLGELLGLYAGAVTWPLWRESAAWRELARNGFVTQSLLQTAPDGVNREQAVWYHRSVLELMLVAQQLAASEQVELDAAFRARCIAMLEYLAGIMDVGGHVPNLGDEDGAVLLRLDPDPDADGCCALLAVGAALFGRGDFKAAARSVDDYGRWLLGAQSAANCVPQAGMNITAPVRQSFPDGGIHVLGDAFGTADEVRVVVDAAPLGYLPIAAHGHADALSLTLSVGGEEVLIDPGTYTYHPEGGWRDYFRGTSAHNTLRIDGEDQSVSGGPFLWLRHATAQLESFDSDAKRDRVTATHDGYQRLADPVRHRRVVTYDKAFRRLCVDDHLTCGGAHRIEQYWHFADDVVVELQGDRVTARTARHVVTLVFPAGGEARLARGEREPLLGWHSRRFGAVFPSSSLVVAFRIAGVWSGLTSMTIAAR